MGDLELALALFAVGLILSLAALRYRKPGATLFAPVWRLAESYEPRGVRLNAVALVLLVIGAIFYVRGTW
jgi:hypothetical protein